MYYPDFKFYQSARKRGGGHIQRLQHNELEGSALASPDLMANECGLTLKTKQDGI